MILCWFRNDLRLHDHPALSAAVAQGPVVPVYVLDPRQLARTGFGFRRLGAYRAQFLLEGLADLRARLQALGSDLVIARGLPEAVLPTLAVHYGAQALHYCHATGTEEAATEAAVVEALQAVGCAARGHEGQTLLHPTDLPLPLEALPEVFTDFRKVVEGRTLVRPPLPAPTRLSSPPLEPTPLLTWDELGHTPPTPDPRAVLPFVGGETAALARLEDYFWHADRLRHYKDTRNGLLGADYSTKFSPWLAQGSLSPRWVYAETKRYERERHRGDGSYWLFFELLWRDYFHFIARKHGPRLFRVGGLRGAHSYPWDTDRALFEAWAQGRTGYPILDANLRELAQTGYMSNRGRQLVASFLTKNLGLDWRLGAEWFESLLIDYDPASNYGNWNYLAGIGNDARGFRYFHPGVQAEKYDPQAHYIKHWLPELATVPSTRLLRYWEQAPTDLVPATDYPPPIVPLEASLATNEARYQAALPDRKRRLGNYKIKRIQRHLGNKTR